MAWVAEVEQDKAELMENYGLTHAMLKQKCSEDDRLAIMEFVGWNEVGKFPSRITATNLEDIDVECRKENKKREALVDLWLEKNGDDATYDNMVTAMLRAHNKQQATTVCDLLRKSAEPQPRGTTLADSPGLAILITCDYSRSDVSTGTLPATNLDAYEMRKTFDCLNYVVYQLKNEEANILELVEKVSDDLKEYNGPVDDSKVIIFAFSGHGLKEYGSEMIFATDGGKIDLIEEIVIPLTKYKKVINIPKLFFIDACRGNKKIEWSGSMPPTGSVKICGVNICMDYATMADYLSFSSPTESMWMPKLARALREQKDSYQNISDRVKREVYIGSKEKKQQCESINRLNTGPLYLQRVAVQNS